MLTLLLFINLNFALAVLPTITLLKKNLFSSSTYIPTPIFLKKKTKVISTRVRFYDIRN